jgi:hypothetical protein
MADDKWPGMERILKAVKHPIGWFTVLILVGEGLLLALIAKAESQQMTYLIIGHIVLGVLVLLLFLVIALARPNLIGPAPAGALYPPADLNGTARVLKNSAFVAASMNAFVVAGQPERYKKSRAEVLQIIEALKKRCGMDNVFYAGEMIKDIRDFDLPGPSLKDDFQKIQEREYFILVWPERGSSASVLVEAGIALTLNKKCIYLVKKEEDLPFLLQGAQDATKNIRVVKYSDIADLLRKIENSGPKLCDFSEMSRSG